MLGRKKSTSQCLGTEATGSHQRQFFQS